MNKEWLTARDFRLLAKGAARRLEQSKEMVNALNVFPVPDGDTGINMALTIGAAVKEMDKNQAEALGEVAEAFAFGSLMGARGNSGVILSQIFRGLSLGLAGKDQVGPVELSKAIELAARTAYQAVMKPTEGTILTVAREGARHCVQAATAGADVLEVLEAWLKGARESLARTPELLSVLKDAGVVDAGGQGLVLIIEGGILALKGELPADEEQPAQAADFAARVVDDGPINFTYCTELILMGNGDFSLDELRAELSELGDSLLVVGTPELTKVHVHSDHPGQVLEACLRRGSLKEIHIDNMREQHKDFPSKEEAALEEVPQQKLAAVSVATGDGLSSIFKSLGVSAVIEGGQSMNPSTEDLVAAIQQAPASKVIVLPNNKNVILTAQQAAELTDKEVAVVPTKTIPQGLAAMLAFNQKESLEENVSKMEAALRGVQTGEVTYAVRNSRINGLEIDENDILGLADGEIKVVGKARTAVTLDLITAMASEDAGLITLYWGQDVEQGEVDELVNQLEKQYPDYDIEIHYGGQPLYYYIISVE
ncbi:MAG: DAK2 domain-containing protein [Firmicutes bacterium]|nr:DAK2 domain-containing protein [Bacillota bacterium]HOB21328.1 DAK2 domain-containing protein [Bacillota bacterium]